jgi:hypothetical protein
MRRDDRTPLGGIMRRIISRTIAASFLAATLFGLLGGGSASATVCNEVFQTTECHQFSIKQGDVLVVYRDATLLEVFVNYQGNAYYYTHETGILLANKNKYTVVIAACSQQKHHWTVTYAVNSKSLKQFDTGVHCK